MTGYGKAVTQTTDKKIQVELKALNSKNLDLNSRIPSYLRERELLWRSKINKNLKRGKVDFSIQIENIGIQNAPNINKEIVAKYIDQLKTIAPADKIEHLKIAIKLPDALKSEASQANEEEYQIIESLLEESLEKITMYRTKEGAILEKDFKLRIKNIQELSKKIHVLQPERIENTKKRIRKALEELKGKTDENRFEQELIYYLEKLDITEEEVRLSHNLNEFLDTLDTPQSNGKKLGFIVQEIGREINTMGSKSNYAPMQKVVITMKDELEKIKEQLLNVL